MTSDDDLLRVFGDRLRAARKAAGLSQEALAHQAGLHRTYVSSVERGERNIALLNILTLATILDIDAGTLLAGLIRHPE
ncbi:helix-turn-helix domain-containing protein [Corynebacterium halotolerans]|uniref:helix-turn-helix domain-containing protein n=1 Tax=Corynebacterium halotolerans TaxID=225326 RepID=UPI003CF96C77